MSGFPCSPAVVAKTLRCLFAVFLFSVAQFPVPSSAQIGRERLKTLPGEKEIDREQMLQIWKAVMAYISEKGQTPDHLSDLVPKYLPDKEVLISPVSKRLGIVTGNNGYADPNLPSSYCYEFSGGKFAGGGKSFREVKQAQMQEFGPVVPLIRLFIYDRVLNVSYSGDFYETELYWETSKEAKQLMEKLGVGPGLKEGEFVSLKVQDAETGKPIKQADVLLTNRVYHFLPMPDRKLKTDDDGLVQVPLGPIETKGRSLKVTISTNGYTPVVQPWNADNVQAEQTIQLEKAR